MGCYVVRCLFGFNHGQAFKGWAAAFHCFFFCFGKVPPHGEAGKQTRQLSVVLRDEWEFKRWELLFQGALRHLVLGSDFNQPLNEVWRGIWCNTTFQMRSSWMNSQELHGYTFLVMIMCSVCTCLNCYHIFAENVISDVDCFSFD